MLVEANRLLLPLQSAAAQHRQATDLCVDLSTWSCVTVNRVEVPREPRVQCYWRTLEGTFLLPWMRFSIRYQHYTLTNESLYLHALFSEVIIHL